MKAKHTPGRFMVYRRNDHTWAVSYCTESWSIIDVKDVHSHRLALEFGWALWRTYNPRQS